MREISFILNVENNVEFVPHLQKLVGSLVVSYTKKSGWYCSAIVNFSAQKERNVRQSGAVFGIK